MFFIDPILFEFNLGFTTLTIRWYGLLVMTGVLLAGVYGAWYARRQDEDPGLIWDALVQMLIAGIIGARIWYVLADIIGGDSQYLDDPVSIIYIQQGGLNILGGVVFGVIAGWFFTRRNNMDFWLLADAMAPGYLIGQAIGRLGNFINQELYGPPTTRAFSARHALAIRSSMLSPNPLGATCRSPVGGAILFTTGSTGRMRGRPPRLPPRPRRPRPRPSHSPTSLGTPSDPVAP
ncbi:MAG: prolipoprotein diacylglyceryl transferase family protein [Chloroflexota bacterium]